MKKITAFLAATAFIASSTFALAGGPIVVGTQTEADGPVVVIANPSSGSLGSSKRGSSGGNTAPLIIGGLLILGIAALLASNNSSPNVETLTAGGTP